MIKSSNVRVRIDPQAKAEAEAVLEELGLTPTVAITMFYKQIVHQQRIPFAIALPGDENGRTAAQLRRGSHGSETGLVAAMHDAD
jgi:DNA-damage-inducible protein J